MSLAEYQRAVMRVLFDAQPDARDLEALGGTGRWPLYRDMARGRIQAMCEVAFKRTRAQVGAARFEHELTRFLSDCPPRTRLLRDVILAFGRHWLAHTEDDGPRCADLLAFECAKWELAYRDVEKLKVGEAGVRELDFEGCLVLNPALLLLRLAHPVHDEPNEAERRDTPLLVYRPASNDQVRWWSPGALFAEIVARELAGETCVLGGQVRKAAERLGLTLSAELLEPLSTDLTLAIERGVVIGVR